MIIWIKSLYVCMSYDAFLVTRWYVSGWPITFADCLRVPQLSVALGTAQTRQQHYRAKYWIIDFHRMMPNFSIIFYKEYYFIYNLHFMIWVRIGWDIIKDIFVSIAKMPKSENTELEELSCKNLYKHRKYCFIIFGKVL